MASLAGTYTKNAAWQLSLTAGGSVSHDVSGGINLDGSVHSFDAARQGALFCGNNPPSDSLAYVVKQKYC